MWKIIRIILSAFDSDDIVILLKKFINKYLKYNEKDLGLVLLDKKKKYSNEEIIKGIEKWSNPEIINNLHGKLNNEEKNQLWDKIKEIENKSVKSSTTETNINDKLKENKWVALSSSWIQYGRYNISNNRLQVGPLTILIQSGKFSKWYGPYIYPSFPAEVWVEMQNAKGQNGSGAGSVFWKFWLRKWLPSKVRKYVKKRLGKEKNIYVGKQSRRPLIKNRDLTQIETIKTYISNLQKGFIRTNFGKNKNEFLTKKWQQERKIKIRTMPKMKTIRG